MVLKKLSNSKRAGLEECGVLSIYGKWREMQHNGVAVHFEKPSAIGKGT
jgi:hypothetical protein